MTNEGNQIDSVLRRTLLKAGTAGAGALAMSGTATARGDETNADDDNDDQDTQANQPEGFEAEVVAPHATFPDDVAAAFGVTYEEGAEDSAFLQDASSVVVVRASLEPGGTSGWHTDQGTAIAIVVEGAVDVTFEDEDDGCVTRTYEAGEAVIATGGHADLVENASDTEPAMGYIVFFGVPDDEPPSTPAEPPDC